MDFAASLQVIMTKNFLSFLVFVEFCAILHSEVGPYGTIHFDSAKRQAKH